MATEARSSKCPGSLSRQGGWQRVGRRLYLVVKSKGYAQDCLGGNPGSAGWSWTRGLTSLGSIFLICKMETIIVNSSKDRCENGLRRECA